MYYWTGGRYFNARWKRLWKILETVVSGWVVLTVCVSSTCLGALTRLFLLFPLDGSKIKQTSFLQCEDNMKLLLTTAFRTGCRSKLQCNIEMTAKSDMNCISVNLINFDNLSRCQLSDPYLCGPNISRYMKCIHGDSFR